MALHVQIIGAAIIALLAALYMIELTPNPEDGTIELGNTQVIMITNCSTVFAFVGDLSKYSGWFPGVQNMTAVEPGPMRNGKQFEETVSYPLYGDVTRAVYVTQYNPPKLLQFSYQDLSEVIITLKLSQKKVDRCILDYRSATRRRSYLYHTVVGVPLRIMYSLRGRHAMFAVRSMFNNNQNQAGF